MDRNFSPNLLGDGARSPPVPGHEYCGERADRVQRCEPHQAAAALRPPLRPAPALQEQDLQPPSCPAQPCGCECQAQVASILIYGNGTAHAGNFGEKVREQGVNVLGKEDWVKETKEIN